MKIKNKKSTKMRAVIYIAVPLLLLFVAAAAWYFLGHGLLGPAINPEQSNTQHPEVNKIDYSPAKESDKVAEGNAKEQLATSDTDSSTNDGALAVTITTAQQHEDTILIRTIIDGTTSGTCTLTASKTGQTSLTRSAPIAAQGHYALCQGFNIAAADFPAPGTWTIQISASTANGSTSSKSITVEVQKS